MLLIIKRSNDSDLLSLETLLGLNRKSCFGYKRTYTGPVCESVISIFGEAYFLDRNVRHFSIYRFSQFYLLRHRYRIFTYMASWLRNGKLSREPGLPSWKAMYFVMC
jgi:hypothetical protein